MRIRPFHVRLHKSIAGGAAPVGSGGGNKVGIGRVTDRAFLDLFTTRECFSSSAGSCAAVSTSRGRKIWREVRVTDKTLGRPQFHTRRLTGCRQNPIGHGNSRQEECSARFTTERYKPKCDYTSRVPRVQRATGNSFRQKVGEKRMLQSNSWQNGQKQTNKQKTRMEKKKHGDGSS